jgi:outer membrane immunogenic protein
METLRRGAIAMVVAVGSVVAALPASANGGPPRSDRAYYPGIWQGLYAGVHVGYGESGPAEGFVGGGQIGYNWQSGLVVYGLEADASFADISVDNILVDASIDFLATARGRLGYLVMPNVLVYGTAGFGVARASGSLSIPGIGTASGSDTETDFVFGLGLEGKLSDTMSARIEYLSFNDLEIDIIRAGVNFRLGN